ncbi:MAG TPA: hypothetical protein V6C64_00945 [Microcoleaceae cyanobacterium]
MIWHRGKGDRVTFPSQFLLSHTTIGSVCFVYFEQATLQPYETKF